ncbi:MAG: hypothetical protein F4207_03180 [Gemmatimonadetes bacterium]|nr:hypothetical protein [Gemmatimonadota bacterium]MYG15419.1 hypothetical protein [Gemmatimonadota bacterium]
MDNRTGKPAAVTCKPYDQETHLNALYENVSGTYAFRASDPDGLSAWQAAFRPKLREALGLDNMASDLSGYVPKAQRLESTDLGSHVRERWYLWVEPTVPLPFYLLLPKGVKCGDAGTYTGAGAGTGGIDRDEALPLVLVPHGHNHPHIYVGISRDAAEEAHMMEGERDIARQAAAEEGYIVIAPTTRAFGETRTAKDIEADKVHSCRDQLVHDLLLGRTPIGERVWDTSRLIDWAVANLPIDADRIAITGNSGGGTISVFASACDTRIALSMPGCYFCTFVGSIGTIHHCECNYVPGLLRLGEMYDVAGLIAPRPFCAIAGRHDPIFPIDHVHAAFDRLKAVYEVAGAGDKCELAVGEGGHRFFKTPAWDFVRRHFGART